MTFFIELIEALGDLICKLEPDARNDFDEIIAFLEGIFGVQG